ncbi:hypothetical protein [Bacillus cereus]|uniref:hypothetical protein n=1 Tax=Bacillus cereus TaxID=1396 RepID=UPI0009458CFB|nr:hypothetical protein [Bacillus cereus]PEY47429.1 hypothetical protein CN348_25600 [Bacillus cereus]PFE42710.1 hypothetical protein CN294_09570 [Bacillus cereus]PFK39906.1 hypothetical protein COJ20_15725 [Bacillus cereus]PFL76803.1 hypothetical protein COJ32_18990 [Bacillus cereus]PFR65916.1 hypothetical protein COK40_30490 [Bacillus cereus]
MSKELKQEKRFSSTKAAMDFKRECIGDYDYKVKADVTVYDLNTDEDDEDYLHHLYVDVHVSIGHNFHKVYIMWEQCLGEDFKKVDNELYGIYYSNYNEMIYSYRQLIIISGERRIVIKA